MTLKFEIPLPVTLTDAQTGLIKYDINTRTKNLSKKLGTMYNLEKYTISILVEVKKVEDSL